MAAIREAVKNPEMPAPEERSTLERLQESVWKRYFEIAIGAEQEKESVIRAVADEADALGKMSSTGTKIVLTKWVLADEGDNDNADIRARLRPNSPTPPLEALGCLFSLASADRRKVLDFVEIRKAHLNWNARRKTVARLPPDAGGGLGILLGSLNGTSDAEPSGVLGSVYRPSPHDNWICARQSMAGPPQAWMR